MTETNRIVGPHLHGCVVLAAVVGLLITPRLTHAQESSEGATEKHMWSHFRAAADMQAAVVRGDLPALKEPATWLAEHDEVGLPTGAEPFVGELRRAALRAAEARRIEEAGAAIGRVAAACGSCHRELGVELRPTEHLEPPPGEADDVQMHMVRHAWAADRLWEGLVMPSGEAWAAGAKVFGEEPLDALDMSFEDPRGVHEAAKQTHALGERAGLETEPSLRARTYGELIASCAACHQITGRQPVIPRLDW